MLDRQGEANQYAPFEREALYLWKPLSPLLFLYFTKFEQQTKFHDMQDALSPTVLDRWFVEDATVKFANNPEVEGLNNIIGVVTSNSHPRK
jgi:hypothetical protein